jgi:hypothetical protein
MDHAEIARTNRRRQVLEALTFERAREAALQEQLETTATELEGPEVDARVFAKLASEDAEIVRSALGEPDDDSPVGETDEEWLVDEEETPELEREELLAELARLEEEMADSRRRQEAFQRYLAAIADLF